MKDYIVARAIEVADYIIETGATVRDAGAVFCLSKSTVHKDMQKRLKEIDGQRFVEVQKVLEKNLSERHLRGGDATKKKFDKKEN